jgi:hypothetical protein
LAALKKISFYFALNSLANLDLVSTTGDFQASQEAAKILDKSFYIFFFFF